MRPACPTSFQTSTNGPRRKPGFRCGNLVTVTAGLRNWENHNTRHNPCDRGRSWCLGWYPGPLREIHCSGSWQHHAKRNDSPCFSQFAMLKYLKVPLQKYVDPDFAPDLMGVLQPIPGRWFAIRVEHGIILIPFIISYFTSLPIWPFTYLGWPATYLFRSVVSFSYWSIFGPKVRSKRRKRSGGRSVRRPAKWAWARLKSYWLGWPRGAMTAAMVTQKEGSWWIWKMTQKHSPILGAIFFGGI